MTNERFRQSPGLKQHVEAIAESIWVGETIDTDRLQSIDNPWALYEIANKTRFTNKERILNALSSSDRCLTCTKCCEHLIQDESRMPYDIFASDECCLLKWKQEMRSNHNFYQLPRHQLDVTISILKPKRDVYTEQLLIDKTGEETIISSREIFLDKEDIAYIYTTAYGKEFIGRLVDYMTSDPVKLLMINSVNIGEYQNELKKEVRNSLSTANTLRNNIHFPDSFYETMSQLSYFFPEESRNYGRI